MKSSGLADSPLFPITQSQPISVAPPDESSSGAGPSEAAASPRKPRVATPRSSHDTTTPRRRDTTLSRHHDTTIEALTHTVREIGKEATTHRFTPQEKKALAEIVYSHKNRGTTTSENEIVRIAINFIVNDYRENGGDSILEKALSALTK